MKPPPLELISDGFHSVNIARCWRGAATTSLAFARWTNRSGRR